MSFRISPTAPVNGRTGKCWAGSTSMANISALRSITMTQIVLVIVIVTFITSRLFEPQGSSS
jgi:hypothetical protein